MSTLVIKEKIQHIRAKAVDDIVTENSALFREAADDLDHSELVVIATDMLAAYYTHYVQIGGDMEPRRSGTCIAHRLLMLSVSDRDSGAVYASRQFVDDDGVVVA